MTNKKKKYLAPEMKVVVLDPADIIATSQFQRAQIEDYEEATTSDWYL